MFKTTCVLTYTDHGATNVKDLKTAVRAALYQLGGHWHGDYLPLHFSEAAYGLYGAAQRTKRYVKRKRRQKGHNRPMVWSGVMARQVLGSARMRVVGQRVGVVMRGVRALNLSSRPRYPDFKAEITAVTGDELRRFAEYLDRKVDLHLFRLTQGRRRSTARSAE
ncbi:MAG TPA: hypothetical protein P5137_00965 [Candidatus Brocadiia bacterium]|nr:hypothetical protein [Candidatus Brocadiia bacterium]